MKTIKEIKGDLWEYHRKKFWIVIPTNGFVKNNGEAVMGRGLALQAKRKFPKLPSELGKLIRTRGNVVFPFFKYRIFIFPVKKVWWEKASFKLIEQSCLFLRDVWKPNIMEIQLPVYLPRVGCGNGKLDWKDVKPILERVLDDRFVVCDKVSNGGVK